jgi:hypothetical protein
MEYVELVRKSTFTYFVEFSLWDANVNADYNAIYDQAAIDADSKSGWEEIADSRLEGTFDVQEFNDMAAVAYKCVSRVSRKRPSMRDVVQALIRVAKHSRSSRNHHSRKLPVGRTDGESCDLEASEGQSSASGHQRQESVGSVSELPDVWLKRTKHSPTGVPG